MEIVGFPCLWFSSAIAEDQSIEIERLVLTRPYKK